MTDFDAMRRSHAERWQTVSAAVDAAAHPAFTAAQDQFGAALIDGLESMGASLDAPTIWAVVALMSSYSIVCSSMTGSLGPVECTTGFAISLMGAVPLPDGWSE